MTRLTRAEQEVHIYKAADEDEYHVYCTDPHFIRLFRKIIKKVGGLEYENQGGIIFTISASNLVISAKKTLTLTDTQRAERSARFTNTVGETHG